MQFLQKNILLQFKDKLFMYSFFEFRVIYLILYGEVSLGVCVSEKRSFINLKCHIFTFKRKETKCNDLDFIELRKLRKQLQGGNKSNVWVSRPVKRYQIYYENTILICANVGCLAESENPEMSLVDPESSEFHVIQ